MVGYTAGDPAGHFVKMVHNGIEYGIMQAYAEGLDILHSGDLGPKYIKEGCRGCLMENPADYQYDINVAEVVAFGVVAVWSVLGCLILPLMYYARRDRELSKFDGGVSDSGEGRWTVHAAVDLGVPALVISTALFERFNSRRLGEFKPCP